MANINDILARAAALRDETALNSISPERAGGIMYDTLLALNDLWLQQGSALVISKIYASVAAMEADTAPISDLTGQPLRPGQIVVIASSDSDNGIIYRYNGTESPSWSAVGQMGNSEPVDSLDSDSSVRPLSARQGKVLSNTLDELRQEETDLTNDVDAIKVDLTAASGQVNIMQNANGFIDSVVLPNVSNFGSWYVVQNTVQVGDTVSLVSMSSAWGLKLAATEGDRFAYTIKRRNKGYFIVFVDADMKFIGGDAYQDTNTVTDYEGISIVPKGTAFILINAYSKAPTIKKRIFVSPADKKVVSSFPISSIYSPKEIPVDKIAGRVEVVTTTALGSSPYIKSSSTQRYAIIPVSPNQQYSVKTTIASPTLFYISFWDAEMKLLFATALGDSSTISPKEYMEIVPEGAYFMVVNSYNAYLICTLVNDTTRIDYVMNPGIIEQNRDVEIKVNAACNYAKIDRTPKKFSMLMIADIHGDVTRFDRHIRYLSKMPAIDAGICLGDEQSSNFYDDFSWYLNGLSKLNKPYLTVIGNHDAGNTNKTATSATVQECYEKYIEPTLDRIGDTTIDKTYYIRLFADYKIAVIVLNVFDGPDTMLDDTIFAVSRRTECMSQAQVNWFINTLQSIPSDYHLMLCYHFTDTYVDRVDCNFTDEFYASYLAPINAAYRGLIGDIVGAWVSGGSISQNYAPLMDTAYLPTIEVNADFSSRGSGILVGHFIGHLHRDFVGRIRNHEDQLLFGFGLGNIGGNYNNGDTPRLDGTKSQDLNTVVAVDTANKAINLVRVGANTTYKLVDRTYLRISYGTDNLSTSTPN